jgi:RNA polymerase sigma-70 factor (ECF subfamily)
MAVLTREEPFGGVFARPGGTTGLRVVPQTEGVVVDDLQALVARAQQNDADAWEALYRRAYPGLLGYARRRLPSREEADDAVSETFARAYSRIAGFEWAGAGFNAWLFGIIRNVVLEAQRRNRRGGPRLVPEVAVVDGDLLQDLLLDEEAAVVRAALALLSPDDQEILELRVVGGLGAEEVGAVLGKKPGAVRMAQSRALNRLRTALGRADEDA